LALWALCDLAGADAATLGADAPGAEAAGAAIAPMVKADSTSAIKVFILFLRCFPLGSVIYVYLFNYTQN
jgi:hypothetical protein